MSKKSEQGNVLEIVIIAVLALALIGVLVWRFVDTGKKADESAGQQTKSEVTKTEDVKDAAAVADPNEGYLVLNDWGVRFKLVGSTQFGYSKYHEGYQFTTTKLETASLSTERSCGVYLSRYSSKIDPEAASRPLALYDEVAIGGYYYYYSYPQDMCSSLSISEANEQLDLIQNLLSSIEAKR